MFRMTKRFGAFALVCLLTGTSFASVAVTGNLKDLTGTAITSRTFVRFNIRNCGGNQPKKAGTGVIVPNFYDLTPSGSGAISGTLYDNSEILCGLDTNTWYGVVIWRDGKPGPEVPYLLAAGSFNLNSGTPTNTVPTPSVGIPVLQNPIEAQTVTQPGSTRLTVNKLTVTDCIGCGSTPTGDGFFHVTSGAMDAAARAVNLSGSDVTGFLPVAHICTATNADPSHFLRGDCTWQAASATPGGSNTQVQFNDSNAFGGDAEVTWDKTLKNFSISTSALADNNYYGTLLLVDINPSSLTAADTFGGVNALVATVTERTTHTIPTGGYQYIGIAGSAIAGHSNGGDNQYKVLGGAFAAQPSAEGGALTVGVADGVQSSVQFSSDGSNLNVASASNFHATNSGVFNPSVTVSALSGLQVDRPLFNFGTITDLYGVDIHNQGGLATNAAAIHIADQGVAATDYAIKVDGGRVYLDGGNSSAGTELTVNDYNSGHDLFSALSDATHAEVDFGGDKTDFRTKYSRSDDTWFFKSDLALFARTADLSADYIFVDATASHPVIEMKDPAGTPRLSLIQANGSESARQDLSGNAFIMNADDGGSAGACTGGTGSLCITTSNAGATGGAAIAGFIKGSTANAQNSIALELDARSGSGLATALSVDHGDIQVLDGAITQNVESKAFSATPTINLQSTAGHSGTQGFKMTLTGNVTSSTLTGPGAFVQMFALICQDGPGAHTFVWPTNVKGAMTISATGSKCNAQNFLWDGTNAYALSPGVTGQ